MLATITRQTRRSAGSILALTMSAAALTTAALLASTTGHAKDATGPAAGGTPAAVEAPAAAGTGTTAETSLPPGMRPGPFSTPEELAAYVNFVTEPDLLAEGRYESASRDGDRFTFTGLSVLSEDYESRAEAMVFEVPVLNADGSLSADMVEVSDALATGRGKNDGETYGLSVLRFENVRLAPRPDGTLRTRSPLDLGAATLEGLRIDAERTIEAIERLEWRLDVAGDDAGERPMGLALTVEGLALGASELPQEKRADVVEKAGGEQIFIDAALSGSLDPNTDALSVDDLAIDIRDVARLNVTVAFGGATPEALALTQTDDDAAFELITLESAELTFERGDRFDLIFDVVGAIFDVRPRRAARLATDAVGYGAGYVGGADPRAEAVWNAAKGLVSGDLDLVRLMVSPPRRSTIAALERALDPGSGSASDSGERPFDAIGLVVESR